VKKWTAPATLSRLGIDLQDHDSIWAPALGLEKIIIPINLNNAHWVCAEINLEHHQLRLYDSMRVSSTQHSRQN
jgi:Ulp1 family protease